ncbi:hypothetical protein [Aidingimonas halophila]|uniref:Uncharacterized protein n=1 Tax=Aidingimonas halophila TaxID=574349 RepID=A0A1H3F027_9GAMM|nr:hypothetical protein [Aidingimonas halophila]GHC32062.1 hypothetical protein GCM10008094_25940 [Aidingimonas halophila]SDX84205.1 hypothetical protein SAMN05443545_107303 [Aidingimonas halophila]
MDAREYLAKKGINLDDEDDKPNTLEELAWLRAREASQHRPNSGTPYDWEDWERYHDTLAEGAEQIEQKIDPEAHVHYQDGVGIYNPADERATDSEEGARKKQ